MILRNIEEIEIKADGEITIMKTAGNFHEKRSIITARMDPASIGPLQRAFNLLEARA